MFGMDLLKKQISLKIQSPSKIHSYLDEGFEMDQDHEDDEPQMSQKRKSVFD